jgi:hypothetical protein
LRELRVQRVKKVGISNAGAKGGSLIQNPVSSIQNTNSGGNSKKRLDNAPPAI